MIGMDILEPAVVLMAWTMVMLVWMYATRLPAMSMAKLDPNKLGSDPTQTLDSLLPPSVQWKAHNYNHLHEAPTVFYAVAITLAIIGQGDGLNAKLAWAYVGLRIVHSLVQAIGNKVTVRFLVFIVSQLVLIALIVHAAMALFLA
jgi:hypothetical protein